MSFIITIYLKEGIVMASDSRTTFNNQETIPATKDGDAPITLMQYGVNSYGICGIYKRWNSGEGRHYVSRSPMAW